MKSGSTTLTLKIPPNVRGRPDGLLVWILPLLVAQQILLAMTYVPPALHGFDDFRQLYTGGYMLRTGHGGELYDYDTQERFEESLIPSGRHFMLPIDHLAFEELLFAPLSLLPYRAAYWVFMAFNGGLVILCAWLLRHRLKLEPAQWKWLLAPLLLLAFFPIARAMEKGQDSVLMLTLLVAALWALDRGKEWMAGLLVGVGLFKFQIVVPIALLFLVWRRWRFFAGFSASAMAAALVSLGLVGIGGIKEYARMLVSMSVRLTSGADIHRYATQPRDMMNLRGLMTALLDGRMSHGSVQFLIAACSVIVLVAAATRRPSLPLAIAAASLVSYHFIVHDGSVLFLVIAAVLWSASFWNSAGGIVLLLAPLCASILGRNYLAAVPLLGVFLLMLRSGSEDGEFAVGVSPSGAESPGHSY